MIFHKRFGWQIGTEKEIDAAGYQIEQRIGRAFIGNVHGLEFSGELEPFAAQMADAADAGRAVTDGAGLFLRSFHHVAQILVALVRRHHQQIRHGAKRDHRRKILGGVVRQVGVGRCRDGVRNRMDHHRVAVRFALGDDGSAYGAASTAAILDHEGLPKLLSQLFADDARDDVGGAAGGKRHDRADRPARPRLRPRETWRRDGGGRQLQRLTACQHGVRSPSAMGLLLSRRELRHFWHCATVATVRPRAGEV